MFCQMGILATWLRWAAMLENAERTTDTIVRNAPSAGLPPIPRRENSGQNTRVIPAIPINAPAPTRAVIGTRKKKRIPTMLRSGLAE